MAQKPRLSDPGEVARWICSSYLSVAVDTILSRPVPEIHFACCWDVEQPRNKATASALCIPLPNKGNDFVESHYIRTVLVAVHFTLFVLCTAWEVVSRGGGTVVKIGIVLVNLFLDCCTSPATRPVSLRDGPAQTTCRASTLGPKLQIKLTISHSNSALTSGQPILALSL